MADLSHLGHVGDELTEAVRIALAALEQAGVSAEDADEFIRDCVFDAWSEWEYGVIEDRDSPQEPSA